MLRFHPVFSVLGPEHGCVVRVGQIFRGASYIIAMLRHSFVQENITTLCCDIGTDILTCVTAIMLLFLFCGANSVHLMLIFQLRSPRNPKHCPSNIIVLPFSIR